MSDTPRTDDEVERLMNMGFAISGPAQDVVDLARQLERELYEAKARIADLIEQMDFRYSKNAGGSGVKGPAAGGENSPLAPE